MSQHADTPRMATVDPAAQDNYIYNRLLKERIIWLGSEVRDDNANAICSQLLLLSAENPEKDIYLYINSPGGSVTAGMAIYDTMQFIPNDVVTVATGLAASMGQFLPVLGHQGQALRHAERPRPDAPAVRRHRRYSLGHQDPGRADPAHEEGHGRTDSRADRPDGGDHPEGTTTATSGSRRRKPSTTASSTRSQPTPDPVAEPPTAHPASRLPRSKTGT